MKLVLRERRAICERGARFAAACPPAGSVAHAAGGRTTMTKEKTKELEIADPNRYLRGIRNEQMSFSCRISRTPHSYIFGRICGFATRSDAFDQPSIAYWIA